MIEFEPQRGIDFPVADGKMSSMATGASVFADAARAVDTGLAERIESIANWRKDYIPAAKDLVTTGMRVHGGSVGISRAGLDSLYRQFQFTRDGGTGSVRDAFASFTKPRFDTGEIIGRGRPVTELSVPYKGAILRGAGLRHQCDLWVANGIVEPSFAAAINSVIDHPEWLDLGGVDVALLGAGAEMGPLRSLLDWGATVWAVDLPRPEVWNRIIAAATVRAGRLRMPVPVGAGEAEDMLAEEYPAVAGADLLNQAPEIRTWLAQVSGPLVLGNYVYADGPLHVRVSLAIDAIATSLLEARMDMTLAWLATPTDVFATPMAAVEESRRRWDDTGLFRIARKSLNCIGSFQPNYPSTVWTANGVEYGVCDCLVPQQGPNYLLAKRLQRWRALVARESGVRVSLNVAPSTRTRSVVKNRALAAAYSGAGRFGLEIFQPETSNALMAALLVHDLGNPRSSANPEVPLAHPMQLFVDGACHGGLWRSPYAARSVLGYAAMLGMFERRA